jgi:metal-dependent amidase/aminoacylase/carboxypeptidase family protein
MRAALPPITGRSGIMKTDNEIIEELRSRQMREHTYEEFLKVIRRRIHRWTGYSGARFFTEAQIVQALKRMGIVDDEGNIKGR